MSFLDWLLSDSQLYRRHRGGTWFKVEHPYGVQPWEWSRTRIGCVVLKTEVYTDAG